MKKIIVIANPSKDHGLGVTARVIEKLCEIGASVYIKDKCVWGNLVGVCSCSEFPDDADMIIVIGGDGSVIDASILAIKMNIPLLGVNLGKVGYLTEAEPDNLKLLDRLVSGDYTVEEKLLLTTEHHKADGSVATSERLAVNDVVISQDGYCGIASFVVENSRSECVRYRGNGIIVATPVGSTAYSLSAGGPIIAHNLDSITVTPVCPHGFFNRSIVYEPSEIIAVQNTGVSSLNISIDGRIFGMLSVGETCRIYASKHKLKMVTFTTNNMFTALFDKIKLFESNG